MLKQGFHLFLLEYLLQRIYFEVFPAHGEVAGCRVELQTMDRLFELESLDNLVGPVVDDVQPSFFSSRQNIVPLTSQSIDV
jgi:hypothetical protein